MLDNADDALGRPLPFDPHRGWLLDGGLGTELGRRGVNIALPLWSANALLNDVGLAILRQIHAEYVTAGAEILTANTFRCHRRSLAKAGLGDRAPELVRRAVATARQAIESRSSAPNAIPPPELGEGGRAQRGREGRLPQPAPRRRLPRPPRRLLPPRPGAR